MWYIKRRNGRLLRAAAARLSRPKVVAWSAWVDITTSIGGCAPHKQGAAGSAGERLSGAAEALDEEIDRSFEVLTERLVRYHDQRNHPDLARHRPCPICNGRQHDE
jgi:hypothetical protein